MCVCVFGVCVCVWSVWLYLCIVCKSERERLVRVCGCVWYKARLLFHAVGARFRSMCSCYARPRDRFTSHEKPRGSVERARSCGQFFVLSSGLSCQPPAACLDTVFGVFTFVHWDKPVRAALRTRERSRSVVQCVAVRCGSLHHRPCWSFSVRESKRTICDRFVMQLSRLTKCFCCRFST